ncbi:cobalamin biosynthesis protein CbiL [Desulfovibrio sp. MES5]|uniref:cobalamin biosynthesis protein CbiL n=1 Tax=Desulfovibrio sp. MES5 TaxID=1899016 RepID=UPI0025BE6615|nr:cobalamin biosynthesis protein CbiL [Desulfovibrio sp. MES5]
MFLLNAASFRIVRAKWAGRTPPGCLPLQRPLGRSLPLSASLAVLLLAAALLLALQTPALAHRVNIFAWTEGPLVAVKCGFSGGNSVRNGEVTVYDAAGGEVLLTGRTDAEGLFRFDIPPKGREHGLRIRINAGEGHQNEWQMEAAELAQAPAAASPAPHNAETTASTAAKNTGGHIAAPLAASTGQPDATKISGSGPVSAVEVQAIVDAALEAQEARFSALLDSRLSPVRRQLAEMRTDEPGIREIVGGMGWFVGLAGLALYFRSRRR